MFSQNKYRMFYNVNNKVTKRQFVALLIRSGILFGLIFLFSSSRSLSEWYMRIVYPIVATILSFISALFPFSLYDLFLIVAILLFIKLILFAILRKDTISKFFFLFIRFITIIVTWFYFSWGIGYFREDFYTRNKVEEIVFDQESLRNFAVKFIDKANRCYTDCSVMDEKCIEEEIEQSYQRLYQSLNISYPNGKRKIKPMMFEKLFTKMGISGYFGPFLNEAHVNYYSLNFSLPFTIAHEMAHQFGIAVESEANLFAFIVCSKSDDKRIRYSAYISTLAYVLYDIQRFLPDEYQSMVATIRPEIITDIQRNRAHWLAARNESLSNMQDKVYDSYLKTNKISSGQENYSEVIGLLISSYDIFDY